MDEYQNYALLPEDLDEMFVVKEIAPLLGVKTSRVHAMIEDGSLPSRVATREEAARLLIAERVKGVPGSGIRLIPRRALNGALARRKRGWLKGRSRKARR